MTSALHSSTTSRRRLDPHTALQTDQARPNEAGTVVLVTDLANRTLAVKEGDTFLYSDTEGNLDDRKDYGLGFYQEDTRFLSHFMMRVSGTDPVLLSSSSERDFMAYVDLTNMDLYRNGELTVRQQTLNIRRTRMVDSGILFERIRVKNYNPNPVSIEVEMTFGADFADIFEVRGFQRERRGAFLQPVVADRGATFGYVGTDGVERSTTVEFGSSPVRLEAVGDLVRARFELHLGPNQTRLVSLTVEPSTRGMSRRRPPFDAALNHLRHSYAEWMDESTSVVTDNPLFNQLLERGFRDLRALYTPANGGGIVAAGIPWYVTIFGRDSLITAHQLLTVNPRLARESLEVLAAHQGRTRDDWRDEEPGKILHEIRSGELARAGEVPHTPYYGSIDSTPWFLLVYAQHYRWTGDLEFARRLRPAAQAALRWIDEYGDMDGDGFVEYESRSERGIRNQGWKDSWDALVHPDGTPAKLPIALVEVQAYVYIAKVRVAEVFEAVGMADEAAALRRQAAELRSRFNEAFWMEDEKFFAFALDGDKRQVRTVVSNPGHALYCDIVDEDKAQHLARRLVSSEMFSGWGIRTMSKRASAYNPMSYHNGSVWPHDNAFIAAGLKRYGCVEETDRVATGLFHAAAAIEYMRLPELFCGFARKKPNPPVSYPVACSPQAWAAGAPFLILQAMLGVSARADENKLTVNKPHLPDWLGWVELRNLRVGNSRITLRFRKEEDITGFSLLRREGDVRVVMEE
jgi:glycogen debranching enzyme